MAITAGAISAGAQVLDYGRCFEALHNFAEGFSACTLGAYISTGAAGLVRFSVQGGLPLPHSIEKDIERRTMREELSRCPWNEMSEPVNMPGVRFAYFKELLRLAPDGLAGMSAGVAGRGAAALFLKETLQKSGCRSAEGSITLALSPDGRLLNIIDETGAEVRRERVLALLCLLEFEKGHDVAVPQEAPVCLDTIARGVHRMVLRYSDFSTGDSDYQARALASSQPFVRDGLMAAMIILSVLKKKQCTLHELMQSVPDFAQAETKMQVGEQPAKYIHLLEKSPQFKKSMQGGILLEEGDGSVLVRPSGGGSLRILAEAANLEIAEELCMRFDRLLKSGALDSIHTDGLQ
jgi:mannose-1-phosphate guanylyltransferase/phosphomannomutase